MVMLEEWLPAVRMTVLPLVMLCLVVDIRLTIYKIRDALFKNLLPFMWVLAALASSTGLLSAAVDVRDDEIWNAIVDMVSALIWAHWTRIWWRLWKNDKDDTWKKRRRRIVEKIELVSGRLVPVPVN